MKKIIVFFILIALFIGISFLYHSYTFSPLQCEEQVDKPSSVALDLNQRYKYEYKQGECWEKATLNFLLRPNYIFSAREAWLKYKHLMQSLQEFYVTIYYENKNCDPYCGKGDAIRLAPTIAAFKTFLYDALTRDDYLSSPTEKPSVDISLLLSQIMKSETRIVAEKQLETVNHNLYFFLDSLKISQNKQKDIKKVWNNLIAFSLMDIE